MNVLIFKKNYHFHVSQVILLVSMLPRILGFVFIRILILGSLFLYTRIFYNCLCMLIFMFLNVGNCGY